MILLVAEDEALIALVLELELRGAGHQVLGPAATPEEALALVEETRPELALIDIDLEDGGDGVALARTLRDRHGVPSLFVSGQAPDALAAGTRRWAWCASRTRRRTWRGRSRSWPSSCAGAGRTGCRRGSSSSAGRTPDPAARRQEPSAPGLVSTLGLDPSRPESSCSRPYRPRPTNRGERQWPRRT